MRMLAIISTAFLLSACATTANFYPVEGPLSQVTPITPLTAEVKGTSGNKGEISLTWTDGSLCTGQWSSAGGESVQLAAGSLMGRGGPSTMTAYTVGNSGGQNPGRAFMMCPDGNTVDMEFMTGAGSSNGFGTAKDKRGNVFRVLF